MEGKQTCGYYVADHITSAPSIRFPVKELVTLCRAKDVQVVVNGAHAPGHLPLNLTDIDADFYVGTSSSNQPQNKLLNYCTVRFSEK